MARGTTQCFGSITWMISGNCTILRLRLRFMAFGIPFRPTSSISDCIRNLRVEINASYIKDMFNNPDIQLGMAMNRWIVGIRPFHFELIHVPGTLHTGLDGLFTMLLHLLTLSWMMIQMTGWIGLWSPLSSLMNTTTLWTSWLGLPHQPDDQVSHLGWFTALDSVQPITKLEMNMTCWP